MSDSIQHQLNYGSQIILFDLHFKDRKSLGIRVYPECKTIVYAPLNASIEKVFEKVTTKAPWILKQLDFFQSFIPKIPERKYISGETHLYLGRQYKLRVINYELGMRNETVKFDRNFISVYALNPSPENIKKILDKWYLVKAKEWFTKLLPECIEKFPTKYQPIFEHSLLIARNMKMRWGSCTPSGKIYLNPDLIKAPKGSIEYVIIHELCHLIHRRHNKDFYALQERVMVDWRKWKGRLESAGI